MSYDIDVNAWSDLISWSTSEHAALPWRVSRSLYRTLISELMLQQTTVAVVCQRFQTFMHTYPDWTSLHRASLDDILHAWQGLGYYQRARNLYHLFQRYSSEQEFTQDLLAGLKQPGIGPYTQGALRSIGLNLPAAALDANIRRVMTRLYGANFEMPYQELLQQYQPRALNEALMDLGRTLCKARSTQCVQCFFQKSCVSAHHESLAEIPSRQSRPVLILARIYCQNALGHVLGIEKTSEQWLSGYLELPTFLIDGDTRQYPMLDSRELGFELKENWTFVSQITKYRIINRVYVLPPLLLASLIGESESYYEFYESHNKMWATPARKVINHKNQTSCLV